jgi:hypothetical protein
MNTPTMVAVTCLLGLSGCALNDQSHEVPGMVTSSHGIDVPEICYVRASNFRGYVPIPCNEAQMARP